MRASGTTPALEGFWFKGDLRSLIGPVKGEGGFTRRGERYGYRLAASRVGDDGSVKLRLGLDPADRPVVDRGRRRAAAGRKLAALRRHADARAPRGGRRCRRARHRRGAVAREREGEGGAGRTRCSSNSNTATGRKTRAIKLTGTAEFRFGKSPRFESVLSARQADLDRALALPEASGRLPLAALKAFIEPFASSYRPAFPVRLGIGVDAVTLAAGTLQNVRGDLKLDDDGWDIETLEFRAPGFAQVRLSGRVAQAPQGVTFKGPAQIEASDPRAFVAWLEGRTDAAQRQAGLLRAGGELTIGAQEFAVERLKFEFDRKTIEGRVAYAGADGAKPPRLDAELKAGRTRRRWRAWRSRARRSTAARSSGRAKFRSRSISAAPTSPAST